MIIGAIFISDDLALLSYSDDPEFDANFKPCCRAVMKAKCCNTPITWAGIMKYEEFLRNTLFCFAGFSMSSAWGNWVSFAIHFGNDLFASYLSYSKGFMKFG